jgi:hypothetical protein
LVVSKTSNKTGISPKESSRKDHDFEDA